MRGLVFDSPPSLKFDDPHDAMHVVEHDDERIQRHVRAQRRRPIPFLHHDSPPRRQMYPPLHDMTEQRLLLPRADRPEVRPGDAVIEQQQADGAAVHDRNPRLKTHFAALCTLLALLLAAAPAHAQRQVLDDFSDLSAWTTATAPGVTARIREENGALRLDFDFGEGGGYAIARRDLSLAIPDNYRLSYRVRADSRLNDLEFKLVDPSGENVWWHNRRQFAFPTTWQTLTTRPRHVSFAWGPTQDRTLREVGSVEFVVAAVEGGRGTLWIDDFVFEKLPPPTPPQKPRVKASGGQVGAAVLDGVSGWAVPRGSPSLTLDFGEPREFGGVVLESAAPSAEGDAHFRVLRSDDGRRWDVLVPLRRLEPRQAFYLPEHEARFVRLEVEAAGAARVTRFAVLPKEVGYSPNAYFAYLSESAPQGTFPAYFDSTQVYWTVTGEAGAMEELLVGQTGSVELRKGAFSAEPFWQHAGQARSWADAGHTQRLLDRLPIPVVTRSYPDSTHLDVTAFVHDGQGVVRYVAHNATGAARNDTLLVLLRPFQVNPPWQFLNGVGGVGALGGVRATGEAGRFALDGYRGTFDTYPAARGVASCSYEAGRSVLMLSGRDTCAETEEPSAWQEHAFVFPLNLAPGARDTFYVALPMEPDAPTRWRLDRGLGAPRQRPRRLEIPPRTGATARAELRPRRDDACQPRLRAHQPGRPLAPARQPLVRPLVDSGWRAHQRRAPTPRPVGGGQNLS